VVAVAKFPLISKRNVRTWIRYEGFEHFEEALRLGRGVVFATGHLGNWELSAFAMRSWRADGSSGPAAR